MNNIKKQENIYDVSTYSEKELYDLLDLNNPSDRELEAKIIFMIKKYNNIQNKSGDQLATFFTDIYNHFFDNDENEKKDNIVIEELHDKDDDNDKSNVVEGFETTPINTKTETSQDTEQITKKDTNQTSNIGFIKPLDYAPDQLNPLLNQTTKRIISIDSQYRDNKTSMPTDFTFNLSSPLKDVVSLKLYSVHIPYTWYTISKSFGSNFFYFKGNSPGIMDNPNHYIFFDILPGNYSAEELISTVNDSIKRNKSVYSDVSFGNTNISYNQYTALASFNVDISKQYNENSYYLKFENYTSPNNYDTSRNDSISSFLGFNNQTYHLNTINSTITLTLDIKNPFYTSQSYIITSDNNHFTIIKYVSNYNSNNNTTDDYNSNSIIDSSFDITLSGLEIGGQYSRNDIVNDLSNQLHNSQYLSSESFIQRFVMVDPSNINFGNAYYQMKIKPNRYNTKNITDSKFFIKFPTETAIWSGETSCFRFPNIENELNTIVAETAAIPQTINYSIVGNPRIIITCSSENFISPLNDILITIQSSPANIPYTLQQYVKAINNGIINATKITPFLTGPLTTNYNYIYKPSVVPIYTYCYIDDNDIFKLFLKINKSFDKTMYSLDLSGTYLYKTLNLGNDYSGSQKVTINDTIPIKGYINNQNLTITEGILPKVDKNKADVKISFDFGSQTFGNQTYYNDNNQFYLGNINLSKSDNDYININNNWSIIGRTYVVTETTYKITCNSFLVPSNNIEIPSGVLDISSSGFSIDESSIPFTYKYISIPNNIENIYFNNESIVVNGSSLIINGNKWNINGNSWTSDQNNNWTINGNSFLTNDISWNITNANFTISNYNNIQSTSITLSGDLLNLYGNNYIVNATNYNTLYMTYNDKWIATGSDYNFVNNNCTINTKSFFANNTELNITGDIILIDNNKINVQGQNLNVSGSNLLFSGNNLSSSSSFNAIGNTVVLNNNNYIITGNTLSYTGNSININAGNVEIISNNMNIYGTVISISGDNLLSIIKNDYNITGNLLSVSDTKFNLERNVKIISKSLLLNHDKDLNLNVSNKPDITIYGKNMYLNGVTMDVKGYNWDVSCELITTYDPNTYQKFDSTDLQQSTSTSITTSNPQSAQDLLNNTNSTVVSSGYLNYNYTLFKNIKFKGDNIYIPSNITTLKYTTLNTVSANIIGDVSTNSLRIQSDAIGMQVDISQCKILSSDLIYITTSGKDIDTNFILDTSYINIDNISNEFSIYARSLTYQSIDNNITFSYSGNWKLSGNKISLFTDTTFTIGSTNYTSSSLGSDGYSLGNGVLQISGNRLLFNDIPFNFSGNIDFIKGYDMFLFSLDNNIFTINKGSFTLNGNTILIDNILNSQKNTSGGGILYLSNSYKNFKLIGDTILTPSTNNYKITSTNKSINYDISATNMNIIGNKLSIPQNIFTIFGDIFSEPTKSITMYCPTNIIVNNIKNLSGNKSSIIGTVTTDGNNISVSRDKISNLYYSNNNGSSSDISIYGNTLNLKDYNLKVIGNINVTNNNVFITQFSNIDYTASSIKLSSTSFNLTNNDTINNFTISGENMKFYGNKWNSYGNLLTIYPKPTSNWKINSQKMYVQDQSFTVLENNFTLPKNNFYIPSNSLKITGNKITIPGNVFLSNSINLITSSQDKVKISSSTYNIFVNTFVDPYDTISWDRTIGINDLNKPITWTSTSSSGFHLDPNSIINVTSNTELSGNNIKISADGSSNFLIDASSLHLNSSQYNIANGGNITFVGKTYSVVNIPINLGTNIIPYDFSINVVYNKTYLPMTNLSSNSNYLAPYVIPNGSTILKIYPRFSSPDNVFGNEYDISYNIKNDTGNDIVNNNLNELQASIISIFESFKDRNGNHILSGSKIILTLNQTDPDNTTVDSELNLLFNKVINNTDYAIEFSNYIDSSKKKYDTWKTNFFIDNEFVDISYGLIYKKESISLNTELNQVIINGTNVVQTLNIILEENINNKLTFIAYEDGTISNDVTITIPVYENGRSILYSRDGLIKTINNLLSNTIAKGTFFSTIIRNGITYVQMKSNINLIYTSKNYNAVFYDTISFVSCYVGAKSVKNTTWDTTVGWILGFREKSIYDLSQYTLKDTGIIISGDTGVCTNLFNYFLLCIDDYTQNHLNDGLVTITSTDKSISLPSYANRTNFICNPVTKELTYNNLNVTDYSKLTQNQIYSITEIANSQNTSSSNLTKGVSSTSFGTGPFVKDIFGLVPMKVSGLKVGGTYIEFGGTLQNQERAYFGPVNIHRMSVKLVTDRGDVVDLNEVNWSFSLLCEQLYKPRPSK